MKKIFYLFLFLWMSIPASAQQKKQMTLEDAVLGYYKGLYPKNLRNIRWSRNSDHFMYRNGDSLYIKTGDGATLKTFTAKDFGKRLPYVNVLTRDYLIFEHDSMFIYYAWNGGRNDTLRMPRKAANRHLNWQKPMAAYTIDNNLYIATKQNPRITVTDNKDKNIVSGQSIARSEFGIDGGTFWSPSGRLLAFYQKDESDVDTYPLVDITKTPAKLHEIKYPMNGRGSEEPAVGVYDPETGKTVYLQLFDKAGKYHYATNLTWDNNEKYIYLAEVNRDQNHMWFNKYDARTGAFVKTLFEEENPKWVEPEHPGYFVPGKQQFVWLSERDGFMNLYLYDTQGKLIRQLTHNRFVAKDVEGFDPQGKYVYFTATGNDPRDNKLFRVSLRSGRQMELTPESGWHYTLLSHDGRHFIDRYTHVDFPGKTCLIATAKPKKKTVLHKATDPLKDYTRGQIEMFRIRGENTDWIYGRMIKPSHFDASKKYPVLVYVYGGPHAQLVQNRWLGGASLWMLWLAEQGYLVFTVDGHGSDNRGFAFESVIYRRLGQIEARDQMDGIAYLKTFPFVDGNRIAVHGWSFGGFMTLTLMTEYPEAFTAGVAGGPVTDWKWYEVMYGERYMDTEKQNPEGFKLTSILNKIDRLQGKLLTIHGYQDDVVVPQHNIALHDRAIAKGIQMDFYLYPRSKHNVYGFRRVHLMKKVLNFIMENNR
ncbi:MAG: prolyl oligopeptidase family serine peptidase [Chlorobi bacterium]|nr:prolyl oligopeptidase family serine peptidase [Chlorobiota bacterium]